jgi:hypothetical protein
MLRLTGSSDAGWLAEMKGTAKVMVPAMGKGVRPSSLGKLPKCIATIANDSAAIGVACGVAS